MESGPERARGFRTGVCLHGHTLYSEECLWFLPRYLSHIPGASRLTRSVDFSRAFFTPPLTPGDAFRLEWEQVAGLELEPMVSLTDHDDIRACDELDSPSSPISVEWTAPYEGSIFHLGIHNLPEAAAQAWMSAMAGYTAKPEEKLLSEILRGLAKIPEVLIVLNHPFWLEEGVEEAAHGPALDRLLKQCVGWLHAFELNGTRVWAENAATIELAKAYGRPTISGGDRHGCEPAACINLTNATSFSEFVSEIRGGHSEIHFLPHYRQPMTLRLMEAVCDILRPYPEYPERRRWMDRFFYRHEDGSVESLAALWKNREPWMLRPATGAVQVLSAAGVRGALRAYFTRASRSAAAIS